MVTQEERDRAARLGRLAAGAGRGIGSSCPYKPRKGDDRARLLALVFVRAYHAAGGTLDGIDYGDGSTSRSSSTSTRTTSTRTTGGRHRAGSAYGGLGYLR